MNTFKTLIFFVGSFLFLKRYLFWLWLWQIKEYHWGRMKAHLGTVSGKRSFIFPYQRNWLYPKLTVKTIPLILLGFIFVATAPLYVLAIAPLFVPVISLIFVYLFKPGVWLWQKYILYKAKQKRDEFPGLKVIGVTGSYGKSSVKEFLAQILSSRYKVLKTKGNFNSEVGVARLLEELDQSYDFLVCEMGAYEKGKINEVARVVQPQLGVITGINEQHLATFGSISNTMDAKFELANALPEDGTCFLNWDSEFVRDAIGEGLCPVQQKRCSMEREADVWAEDIVISKDSVSFVLRSGEEREYIELGVAGKQNVINFVLASAVALELGFKLEEIARVSLEVPHSGLRVYRGEGVTVIDDSYSSNPHGVFSALEYLDQYDGSKVLVMPCLIELGDSSDRVHKDIWRRAKEVCDLVIVTKPDCCKEALHISNKEVISQKIRELSEPTVLLEGRVPDGLKEMLL